RLYRNRGDGTCEDVAELEGVAGQSFVTGEVTELVDAGMSAAFIDYNSDGLLDLAVTNGEGQTELAPYFLYRNEGVRGRWLAIELEGVASEVHGLGAEIHVHGATGDRYRYQSGPHHLLSQSLLPVHVGLGRDRRVTVTVTWPSGTVDTIDDVRADQRITVREGVGLVDGDVEEPGGETSGNEGGDEDGTTGEGSGGGPGGSPGEDTSADTGRDRTSGGEGEDTRDAE